MSNGGAMTPAQRNEGPTRGATPSSGLEGRWTVAPLLLCILIFGAFLRFQGIEKRGPIFFDEGIYTLEGRWIYTAASSLKAALQRKLEEVRSGRDLYTFQEEAGKISEGIEGQPPVWGRPAFSLLTAISMAWIGPKIYAANAVSVLLGTLSILIVFLLARSMFSPRVGLLAALLFALSGYHYAYSVTGLADVSALFFSLVSFLLYYQSRKQGGPSTRLGWIIAAGISAGLAFTVHDRFLYAFLVILSCEALDFLALKGARKIPLKRGFMLCGAFLIPLFLFELPYYLGMVFLRHFHEALPFRTYFEELFSHHIFNFLDVFAFTMVDPSTVPEAQEAGSRLYNFLTYPYLYYLLDGPVFLALFFVGFFSAIRTRSRPDVLLLVWFCIPFVLCSMGLAASVRYGLIFLPAAVILAARSILVLTDWTGRIHAFRKIPGPVLAALFLIAVFVSNAAVSSDMRRTRCSYAEPARFLEDHGRKHISLEYPVSQAYFGIPAVRRPPHTREELAADYQDGYRYYLVDFRKWFLRGRPGLEGQADLIDEMEQELSPAFTYVHPCYSEACYLFEANVFFKATLRLVRESHAMGLDQIRIYDLRPLFEPAAAIERRQGH